MGEVSAEAITPKYRSRNEEDSILQQALSAASLGAWSYDLDTNEVWWSDRMYDLHGVDPLTKDLPNEAKSRVHEEDHPRMIAEMHEHVYQGKPVDTEFRVCHPERGIRWLHSQGKMIVTSEGSRKIVGVTQDVTARRDAEALAAEQDEMLRRERERLDLALLATDLGVWHCDLPFDKLVWNRQVKQHFGVPEDSEVTIEIFFERLHPEDRERTQAAIETAISSHTPMDIVYRTVGIDGELRYIRAMGSAFYAADGTPVHFDGVTVDVTERMEAETELEKRVEERTSELKAINSDLESFCYSIAHDLRAPLRAIIATSMILMQESNQLPAEELELLEQQARNAKRLSKLINDLLDHSRLSRKPLTKGKCNLTELARGLAKEVRVTFPEKDIEFDIQPEMYVEGDPLLLRSAIAAVLENACKFSRGAVTVTFGASEAEDKTVFWIKDDGIGFDMRYSHKIFLPFERLHRDEEFPGTGIGLANAQKIIARHGGTIWVESEPGAGSTFFFTV